VKARTAALVLFATAVAGAPAARAHQQTTSFAEIAYPVDGGDLLWRIRFRAADLVRAAPGGNAAAVIASGLRVSATRGDVTGPCRRTAAAVAPDPSAPEPSSVFVGRYACGAGARALHLRYDVLFDRDPYHASYARLAIGDAPDDDAATVVFYDRQREVTLDVHQPEPLWRTALMYLRLGTAHILSGADHLAFLAALLLAAAVRGRRPARPATTRQAIGATLGIVSAFTVAHSITLAAQVLHPGLVPTRWVEPAIAFSVAFVAAENLLPRAPRGRWALVFGFGLVHGLGFASALREIGLPRRGLVLSLVSFNLGVELGQLLVVALALPILVAAARRDPARYERWGLRGLSGAIALAGAVWLVARVAAAH